MNRRLYYLVIMITCFLITGCNQKYEERNSGISENSSESQERQPFEDMSDVTVYEFDPDNILGLKAICLKDNNIIYRFNQKLCFREDGINVFDKNEKFIDSATCKLIDDVTILISCNNIDQVDGIKVDIKKDWDFFRIYKYSCPTLYLWRGERNGDKIKSDSIIQNYNKELKRWDEPEDEQSEIEYSVTID